MRRLAVIVVLLAAGCGGSEATPPAPSPTATPERARSALESPETERMPQVPAGAERLPAPSAAKVHDPGQLHAAFASAEAMWEPEFAAVGGHYQHASLTFFHKTVRTKCGEQSREVGPFYCPPAHGVYLNTVFFDALARKFELSSGFAAGYIVGHEVGHHVQELLGLLRRVAAADASDPDGANARSVQVELQADCYAGLWLHTVSARGELSEEDIRDITTAATVVGDDFQRNQAGLELAPETWTHGSSAQRVHWVSVGLQQGRPAACDTFS
jgi:predicted metalloprotease